MKEAGRVYGKVVLGYLAPELVSNYSGKTLNAYVNFESITVRSINSSNGVYSLNKLTQDVDIVLDSNFWVGQIDSTISVASVPYNLQFINTEAGQVYMNTTSLQLLKATGGVVATLDKPYTAITNTGSSFVGAVSTGTKSALYHLTSLPAALLVNNLDYNITALTVDGANNLWAVSGTKLVNLGQFPYTGTHTSYETSLELTGITYVNGGLVGCTNGYPDFANPPLTFGSQFFTLTPSGSATNNIFFGNIDNRSSLISIASVNGAIYGVAYTTGTGYVIYHIDPTVLTATQVMVYEADIATKHVSSLFIGGNQIILNPVVPLKSINGLTPTNNNLSIVGSNVITVTQENNDTIVFSLPIKDANLNVSRTTQYA